MPLLAPGGCPAKTATPTRVLRGSRPRSSWRAAATSAARIVSPGSVLPRLNIAPMGPRLGLPTIPIPLMSAPVGSTVEREVSITSITSKCCRSPSCAIARPATKTPQAVSDMTAPSGGYSISRWTRVGSICCLIRDRNGGIFSWREALRPFAVRARGVACSEARAARRTCSSKAAKGRPLPSSRGLFSAARSAVIGEAITWERDCGEEAWRIPTTRRLASEITGAPPQPVRSWGTSRSTVKRVVDTSTTRPKRSSSSCAPPDGTPSSRTRSPRSMAPFESSRRLTPIGGASRVYTT